MQKILFLLSVVVLYCGCTKTEKEGTYVVRGRLFATDEVLLKKEPSQLPNRRVFLATVGDSLNYLYADTTDGDGYFVFSLLPQDLAKDLQLRFADTVQGHPFRAIKGVNGGEDNVALIATFDQKKGSVLVLKTTDGQGGALPTTTLRFFSSLGLSTINDSGAAARIVTTDGSGVIIVTNITPGNYYVNARKGMDTVIYEKIAQPIHVPAMGLRQDSIALVRRTVPVQNTLTIQVVDSLGGTIPGARVYLFTSPVLAAIHDTTGTIDALTTNAQGKIVRNNLDPITYYLNAFKTASGQVYGRTAKTVTMFPTGLRSDTMMIHRVQ